jgi:hypothetical protein
LLGRCRRCKGGIETSVPKEDRVVSHST